MLILQDACSIRNLVGCRSHLDVCLTAVIDVIEEDGELVHQIHLLLAGSSSGACINEIGQFVLQCLRHVGILGSLFGVHPRKVADDCCTSHIALEHSGQHIAGLLGSAQIVETDVTHHEPVVRETRTQVACTHGKRAVSNLHSGIVHVASAVECIGSANHVTGHVTIDVLIDILFVCAAAADVAVHSVLGIIHVNHVLADGHHEVGIVVQIELTHMILRVVVTGRTLEGVCAHHIDTIGESL